MRPTVPIGADPLAWWKFAAFYGTFKHRKAREMASWSYIQAFCNDRRQYVDLYTKIFITRYLSEKGKERDLLDMLERKYPLEHLMVYVHE
mgnify:CR=1 FL=1